MPEKKLFALSALLLVLAIGRLFSGQAGSWVVLGRGAQNIDRDGKPNGDQLRKWPVYRMIVHSIPGKRIYGSGSRCGLVARQISFGLRALRPDVSWGVRRSSLGIARGSHAVLAGPARALVNGPFRNEKGPSMFGGPPNITGRRPVVPAALPNFWLSWWLRSGFSDTPKQIRAAFYRRRCGSRPPTGPDGHRHSSRLPPL